MCKPTNYLLKFVIALLIIPVVAKADVHNCSGVWTDQPCDSPSLLKKAPVETSKSESSAQAAKERSQKRYLVQELALKRGNAERDYGFTMSTLSVENFCLRAETALSDCEAEIKIASDQLDNRIMNYEKIRQQQRSIEIQEQLNRQRAGQAENNVVIVQQPADYGYYEPPRQPPIIINNNQTQVNVHHGVKPLTTPPVNNGKISSSGKIRIRNQ